MAIKANPMVPKMLFDQWISLPDTGTLMDKYQEQGQLLEPYLESIVSPLMSLVHYKIIELGITSDEVLYIIQPLCITIYSLVTVCGYKAAIKFFPHQVCDLELVVSLLEKSHGSKAANGLWQESTGEMEAKCVVLLWLCLLVLIPFDISYVDTNIVDKEYSNKYEPPPLVLRILKVSKDYLSTAGMIRSIAGLLLSKLLTRPDMPKAFTRFLSLLDVTFTQQLKQNLVYEHIDSVGLLHDNGDMLIYIQKISDSITAAASFNLNDNVPCPPTF